jgi:hypothetical protein
MENIKINLNEEYFEHRAFDLASYSKYLNFFLAIRENNEDNPLCKECAPYKENLKLLFDAIGPIKTELYSRFDEYKTIIDRCVILSKNLGDIKLDKNLIAAIRENQSYSYDFNKTLKYLFVLYTPELVIDDFPMYLKRFQEIIKLGERFWKRGIVNTGYQFIDELFTYLGELSHIDEDRYKQIINYLSNATRAVAIIASIHYNRQINSDKHLDSISYYMDNLEGFIDKLNMNNIIEKRLNDFSDEILKYVFDNIESVVQKSNSTVR